MGGCAFDTPEAAAFYGLNRSAGTIARRPPTRGLESARDGNRRLSYQGKKDTRHKLSLAMFEAEGLVQHGNPTRNWCFMDNGLV